MTHIDATRINVLRKQLRGRALQLREEIRQTLLRSDDESYVHIAEQARDIEDDAFADLIVDVNLAEVDRDLGELREIDATFQRMADGTYGHCEDCGGTIDPERLDAEPTAARCVRCQRAHEHRYLQKRGPSL